jgi:hypothetical protein
MATTCYYEGEVAFLVNAQETKRVFLSISENSHGLLIKIADNLFAKSETDITVFASPEESEKIGEAACNAVGAYRKCRERRTHLRS